MRFWMRCFWRGRLRRRVSRLCWRGWSIWISWSENGGWGGVGRDGYIGLVWGAGWEGRWEMVLPVRRGMRLTGSGQELGFYTVVDINITAIFRMMQELF